MGVRKGDRTSSVSHWLRKQEIAGSCTVGTKPCEAFLGMIGRWGVGSGGGGAMAFVFCFSIFSFSMTLDIFMTWDFFGWDPDGMLVLFSSSGGSWGLAMG